MSEDQVRCPTCGSTQLTAQKKGFGLGKAVVGSFLMGPLGLAGGLLGVSKIKIVCLACGYEWSPGK